MTIKATKSGDSAELELFGVVGEGWSDDGISARRVKRELRDIGSVATLRIKLSSVGGYVDEGVEIYQMFADHPAHTICTVGAQAVSCGSLIAVGCDEVIFHATSLWLAHNPWALAIGDYAALEKRAAGLKLMASVFADAYVAKTGKSKEEILSLMDEDRYMDAEEAKEWGFCTSILPSKKKPSASGARITSARSEFEAMKEDARSRLQRAAAMVLSAPIPDSNNSPVSLNFALEEQVARASAHRRLCLVGH
jgi:ATP-dependent protease ClpP protease subunit